MNGVGIYTWSNGDQYIGEYLNDKKHGNGILNRGIVEIYNG